MAEDYTRINGGDLLLELKATPGSSKTCLAGVKDGRLRVRIAAAAEDGKANEELIKFFASALGCAKRDITLLKGEKSRLKTLAIPLSCKAAFDALDKG